MTVTGSGGNTPTGNVTFDWFTNNTCSGAPAASSGPVALSGSGSSATADATGFVQTPSSAGGYSFIAHFPGDVNYTAKDAACEPLAVVDAKISISPLTVTNAVGTPHIFTASVQVNSGSGFAAAPNGTVVTFSIVSGPGSLTPANGQCTTTSGTCTISVVSSTPGNTVLNAATSVTVGGITLTRATGDTHAGDGGNATKIWVDATLGITPSTATNAVGTTHTLTITAAAVNGSIDPGTYTATASIVSGPGAFVGGTNTCTFTDAAPSCKVAITSPSTGTTVVHATSSFSIAGTTVTRSTGTAGAATSDAAKTWVDGNVSITPASAVNAVNANHTLTITVAGVNGSIDTGTYTATASLVGGGVGSFVGGVNTCTYTDATKSCTVVISSPSTGTTVVHAKTTFSVAGQPITRETNTAVNTTAGGSGDATKTWVDANVKITPATATNAVGTNHTLTITVTPVHGAIDAGTYTATASLVGGGVGSFVGGVNTCTYTAAAPTCAVVITSAVAGQSTVHVLTTLKVSGQSITRETTGTAGNSGDATKTWVDGNVKITPATATNAVGSNHTLTITVAGVNGAIDAGTYTATASLLGGGVGSFVGGVNTCTYTAAAPTCTVVITSASAGTTTVHAKTTFSVAGQSITRETTGTAGDSGDAHQDVGRRERQDHARHRDQRGRQQPHPDRSRSPV